MYTLDDIKNHLGEKFNPEATYILDTHAGARNRIVAGTHRSVGQVPDSTTNENGTMVVLEKLPMDDPK
jgi:hypothetical protein